MAFTDLLAITDNVVRATLGSVVLYTPGGGSAQAVAGIFDAVYVRVDAGNPGISSAGPALFVGVNDLSSDPLVDLAATVTIGSTVYTIHEVQPDGIGGLILLLHLV